MTDDLYGWPNLLPDEGASEDDLYHASWAYRVRTELNPVYEVMSKPLPDDPHLLDDVITQQIDGWLPRVASLAVKAEYFLAAGKASKWPSQITPDGEKLTVADREVLYESRLATRRFVRDELDSLVKRMNERVRWGQSVRKQQNEAQY